MKCDMVGVVPACNAPGSACHNEATPRLWLLGPGVGECSPAGLKHRKPVGVVPYSHRLFVDSQTRWDVPRCRHGGRHLGLSSPCCQGCSVSKVVAHTSAAGFGLIPPAFCLLGRGGNDFFLTVAVVQRSAVSVVEMPLFCSPDCSFADQPVEGAVARIPGERPVCCQYDSVLTRQCEETFSRDQGGLHLVFFFPPKS